MPDKLPYGFRMLCLLGAAPVLPLADCLELAEAAEAAGFGAIAVGDAIVDNLTFHGALAVRTRHVELHSTVATLTRTPVAMALTATTLAELSSGRFRLGLGVMSKRISEDHHGVEFAQPVERMRDYVAAVRAAMRARPGSPVDHEGPFYRFRGYERLTDPPDYKVPIYLGVIRPRMAKLAGEIADGVIVDTPHSAWYVRDVLWPRFEEGLAASGRGRSEFDVGVALICAIADRPREARDLARRTIAFYLFTPRLRDVFEFHGFEAEYERGLAAWAKGDVDGAIRAMTDEVVETIAVTGTPGEFREKLSRYEGVVDWIRFGPPHGHPPAVIREQTEKIIAALGRGS